MRAMLLGLLVVALAPTVAAQDASNLDAPVRGEFRIVNPQLGPPCSFWTAVDQIARRAHVLVGFESSPNCGPGDYLFLSPGESALDFTGMGARQAFDHLVALDSIYRWQDIAGVVVIRPKAAWDDPKDVLNRPTAAFSVSNAHVHEALHALLQAVTPSLFWPHTDVQLSGNARHRYDPSARTLIDAPVSFSFPGGTMLEALNAVTRAYQSAIWHVGYGANRAIIELSTLTFPHGIAIIGTAPLALPEARR